MGSLTTEEFKKLLKKALEPLRKSIDQVQMSFATANSNFDQLLTKMSSYEKRMTDLVNENKSLKAELLDTTNQFKILKESFNNLEQYSRRDCLELQGIPKSLSDSMWEDTNEVVVELDRKIGIDLKKEDISTSHRLSNKVKMNGERAFPPAIIVKFTSRDVREKLYRARKVLKNLTSRDLGYSEKNRIFINESLTLSNKERFKGCLKVKKEKGFKFLWTSGGTIFMRKDQHVHSKVIQINNANALRKIGEEMSYAQAVMSP